MTSGRLVRLALLGVPAVVLLVLLQSYAWVPTYDSQLAASQARARTLVEASSGDARILNPVLNADTASSRIVGLLFEGLLELDEDLRLRGRLARDWRLHEVAWLAVPPGARLADGSAATADELAQRIARRAAAGDGLDLVEARAVPAGERMVTLSLEGTDGKPREHRVQVAVPPRVRLQLRQVTPALDAWLEPLLGAGYGAGWQRRIVAGEPSSSEPAAGPGPQAGDAGVARQLATALPVIEHNPVITFELRRGVRFHDGEPLDADDVRFTYEAIMAPRNLSPRRADFEPVKSLQVLDSHTVQVTYKRLFSPAVNAWTMGILPEHLLNDTRMAAEMEERGLDEAARQRFGMRDSRFNRRPVGTGQFRFVRWDSDEVIELARNAGHWLRAPELTDFHFRIMPDLLAQELEFRAGALDIYAPQPHQVERYRADSRYQAFSTPTRGYTYIGYNNRRPPLDDARVRRALGMAIDVQAILDYVLYGQADRTTGPYPLGTPWYDPDLEPLPHDPEAAGRLLAELGWTRGADGWLYRDGKRLELNLITNNGNPVRKAVLAIAQASWQRIGVKTNTQVFEWAVFLEDFINPADFDAVILGWVMGIDHDLYQLWHSSQAGFAQLNFTGYRSARADQLIEAIRAEYDHARLTGLTRELHRLIAADQPYTFLFAPRGTRVLDRKLVMVGEGGELQALRASRAGDLDYFLDRWLKSDRPVLDAGR